MDYIALGKKIRHFRQLKGMTQEQLAKQANISGSFLGHIERGSRKASLETLVSIANILSVKTDSLLKDSLTRTYVFDDLEEMNINQKHLVSEIFRLLNENRDSWT